VQDIGASSFYYGHPSSHCTSGLIATSSYYTTLEYDECVLFFSEFVDMPPRLWSIWKYEREVGSWFAQVSRK